MAWNRNDSKSLHGVASAERKHSVPPVLLVPLAMAALAAGVWWALCGGRAGRATKPDREGRAPSRPPSQHGCTVASAKPPYRRGGATAPAKSPLRAGPTNRVALTKNVKPPTVLGCNYYECVSGGRPLFARPVFTNSAENIIGGLLAARPGERFVPVELGEDFDEDFRASLGSPIEVSEDDDHDTATLKAAVAKAKEQIAAGMQAGQRPSEVVTSMRDEMNKIADYRDLLQADFDRVKETGSAHQIEAYLKEANQLLDEFGAEHLGLPDDEVEEINRRLDKNPGGAGEDK